MKKYLLILSLFIMATGGCNISDLLKQAEKLKDKIPPPQESYRYIIGNCDTGEHSASSLEQYCNNLQDDKLNNNCANEERKAEYDLRCK